MNIDINKILNNPKVGGVTTALPASLNLLQIGLGRLNSAMNYNPYNVVMQQQSFNGKPIMGDGGLLKGNTHENGGIKVNENGITTTPENAVAEVEHNEYKYVDPKTKEVYIFSNRLPYKIK